MSVVHDDVTMPQSQMRTVPFVEVALVPWPGAEERRVTLRDAGMPRLLLVPEDCDPPVTDDVLEDWVRTPADPREVQSAGVDLAFAGNSRIASSARRQRPAVRGHTMGRTFADRMSPHRCATRPIRLGREPGDVDSLGLAVRRAVAQSTRCARVAACVAASSHSACRYARCGRGAIRSIDRRISDPRADIADQMAPPIVVR
jgi:hypothetical protein